MNVVVVVDEFGDGFVVAASGETRRSGLGLDW